MLQLKISLSLYFEKNQKKTNKKKTFDFFVALIPEVKAYLYLKLFGYRRSILSILFVHPPCICTLSDSLQLRANGVVTPVVVGGRVANS